MTNVIFHAKTQDGNYFRNQVAEFRNTLLRFPTIYNCRAIRNFGYDDVLDFMEMLLDIDGHNVNVSYGRDFKSHVFEFRTNNIMKLSQQLGYSSWSHFRNTLNKLQISFNAKMTTVHGRPHDTLSIYFNKA